MVLDRSLFTTNTRDSAVGEMVNNITVAGWKIKNINGRINVACRESDKSHEPAQQRWWLRTEHTSDGARAGDWSVIIGEWRTAVMDVGRAVQTAKTPKTLSRNSYFAVGNSVVRNGANRRDTTDFHAVPRNRAATTPSRVIVDRGKWVKIYKSIHDRHNIYYLTTFWIKLYSSLIIIDIIVRRDTIFRLPFA